jgi:hypothetical protein
MEITQQLNHCYHDSVHILTQVNSEFCNFVCKLKITQYIIDNNGNYQSFDRLSYKLWINKFNLINWWYTAYRLNKNNISHKDCLPKVGLLLTTFFDLLLDREYMKSESFLAWCFFDILFTSKRDYKFEWYSKIQEK